MREEREKVCDVRGEERKKSNFEERQTFQRQPRARAFVSMQTAKVKQQMKQARQQQRCKPCDKTVEFNNTESGNADTHQIYLFSAPFLLLAANRGS